MKVVWIVLLAIAAVIVLYILFLIVCALFVNPKKEYEKDSKFYRNVLGDITAIGLWLAGVRMDVKGIEKVPAEGRFLFVCNHRSKFDPIVTWHALRKFELAFISKASNFKIFVFGRIIRKCCFMAIDREDPRKAFATITKATKLIKEDEVSVAVYPEGTRNLESNDLLPFHDGVFMIAQNAKVPIVVAAVDGTELIRKNFPFRTTKVRLEIVETIDADTAATMRRNDISDRVRKDFELSLGL